MVILGVVLIVLAGLVQFAILSLPAALFTVGVILVLVGLLQNDVIVPRR